MKSEKEAELIYNKILKIIENKIGNKSTYASDLTKVGKKLFGDKYLGTYARDEIPQMKNKEMCIVNTDPSGSRGTHWVSLYKHKNHIYQYDSFGRKNLLTIKNYKDADNDAEQYKLQDNCGQRCLSWLCVVHFWNPDVALLI